LLFAASLALCLASRPGVAEDLPQSGDPVFDRAVELVVDHFHDVAALEDFKDTVRRVIEGMDAPSDPSDAEVDSAIDTVLASLDASHTGRFKADTIAYFELADIFRFALREDIERLFPPEGRVRYSGIGMIVRPQDGTLFVSDVYDGAPADRAGILVGDEILSVDGEAYHEIDSFHGKVGRDVTIRLRRRESATPIDVDVPVRRLRPLRTFEKAIENSISVSELDGKRIGYARLWTLATGDGLEIVARELAIGRLAEADGLVVDLRGRWGGGAPDAAELFVGDTPSFSLIGRDGETMPANVRWRRPVVAIIDEGTRSGLELFAYGLKMNGIPLVGAQTAGALLAGRAYLLPDDSLLEIAVADAVIGENVRLEGRGVAPDIAVPFRLPHAAGEDPQRDAAMDELLRILAEN
jgi:C-terminal processing protease CtpA/Prc